MSKFFIINLVKTRCLVLPGRPYFWLEVFVFYMIKMAVILNEYVLSYEYIYVFVFMLN